MRILHLVSVWGTGGVKGQVRSVAERMAAQGHELSIAVLRYSEDESVSRSPVPVVQLCEKKTILEAFRAFHRARKLVRSFRPDVVHCHSFHANVFGRLLRLIVKIPYLVSTFHTSVRAANTDDGGWGYMLTYRATDWLSDISTNVSRESSESFVTAGAVPRKKIVTVYDGIDIEKFVLESGARKRMRSELSLDESMFVWLAVGRLCLQKDYPNLLRAFQRVAEKAPKSVLLVVGDGSLREDMEKQVRELHLQEQVRFLGVRSDVPLLMAGADGYVLSSAWEGFPNVVAEAMASGLATVATDSGGVAEMVGDTGWLVPPHNSEALSSKMLEVFGLEERSRIAIGKKAQARVSSLYSLSRCCDVWLALFSRRVKSSDEVSQGDQRCLPGDHAGK